MTISRMQEPRQLYGLGSLVKSIGKGITGAVKGVARGAKKFAKSDIGKAAIIAGLAGIPFGPNATPGFFGPSSLFGRGASFLSGLPSLSGATEAFSSLGPKGKFFSIAALGSGAAALLGVAEEGGLDTSDPNAEIDLESLKGYLSKGYKNLNPNATDEEVFQFVQENTAEYRAEGGRIGRAMGSDDKVEMAAGIEGLPININPKGIKELDLRETGGFIQPVGVKEKADDIPAMLSNNEFVFTADAVRAAGGGSVDKGAQIMYDTMKRLESKVV